MEFLRVVVDADPACVDYELFGRGLNRGALECAVYTASLWFGSPHHFGYGTPLACADVEIRHAVLRRLLPSAPFSESMDSHGVCAGFVPTRRVCCLVFVGSKLHAHCRGVERDGWILRCI